MTEDAARKPRVAPAADAADRAWLARLWQDEWDGETMVGGGRTHRLDRLAALLAWDGAARAGAATYAVAGDDCELVSINATPAGRGIGSALLAAVEAAARAAGCRRVRLVTTNDNLDALRFYQRRGYRLVALRPGAVDEARRLKPAIPAVGAHGIPLRDELELAKAL
ncbi:MAG TPA: GNAT family N-acetyltransferase [Thermomicrobiales bacterium]|nr:GNAT family N-acetyltransferase [Thermomicrobiales bacterium]